MTPTTPELTAPRDSYWTPGSSSAPDTETTRANAAPTLLGLLLQPGRAADVARVGAVAGLALLGTMFWAEILHFVWTWSTDANYSHGFLVPLISLYFANEASKRGPIRIVGGIGSGVALLVVAILGRLATLVIPVGLVGGLSLLLGLAGLLALAAGRDALRRYGFALAFLVFMVPLPIALYTTIASPLQLLVSRVAAGILNVLGTPVLCQGNLMTLPGGVRMFVAEACSGMRQLTGFLALTTAVAYLSARPWWYRGVLIASSVPIAMTANVIRVVMTGLIMHHLDPSYASGSLHTLEGLLMMGLGLALLAAECSVLSWAVPIVPAPADARVTLPSLHDQTGARGLRLPARLGWSLGLLVAGLAAQTAVEGASATVRPRLNQPLATVSYRLGPWVGRDLPVDPRILKEAQCDDYLNRCYEDSRQPGRTVSLWINYSQTGLNLRHSPEICLPSGGWEKVESQMRVLDNRASGRSAAPADAAGLSPR